MERARKRIIISTHAAERLRRRGIDIAEVQYAVAHASVEVPGRSQGAKRLICDIASGRKLSVVFKEKEQTLLLISAWWVE
jgi:uncharacterized DUF497 family protein